MSSLTGTKLSRVEFDIGSITMIYRLRRYGRRIRKPSTASLAAAVVSTAASSRITQHSIEPTVQRGTGSADANKGTTIVPALIAT